MFGRKSIATQVKEEEKKKEQQELTTVQVIRESLLPHGLDFNHLGKMFACTNGRLGIDIAKANDLRDAGFIWFVKPEFVAKFKYHACLCGDFEGGFPTIGWSWPSQGMQNLYVGDVPDSVGYWMAF
jgi:hypothetical protein